MLFVWTSEGDGGPSPKGSAWFAWSVIALVFWLLRRRIIKSILAMSPLRLFKKRLFVKAAKSSGAANNRTLRKFSPRVQNIEAQVRKSLANGSRHCRRFCQGDGPPQELVANSGCVVLASSPREIVFKVTRSGRVYGEYPHVGYFQKPRC